MYTHFVILFSSLFCYGFALSSDREYANPFLSRQQSSIFLQTHRNKRSGDPCADETGYCESHKGLCRKESDRETYCHRDGTACPAGQFCQLTTPCPRHFTTGCVDIDECQSSPCKNGATCTNGNNAYRCTCRPGWTGVDCNTDVNECITRPCKNGATCINGQNKFSCSCVPGWEGATCENDVDECLPRPCRNGASCINGRNKFSCSCMAGWEGATCDKDVDECLPGPCQNGASCTNGRNTYSCSCSPDVDECLARPCQNGATCTNGRNMFSCLCTPGWKGVKCDTDIDECLTKPCKNGASCINGRNTYSCSCVPGWQGINCEKDIDECLTRPCKNGASCTNGRNTYSCSCTPGWEGINCEKDIDECLARPCQNGASCINGQNMFSCLCIPGWEGINCEKDIDECLTRPCQNGASCINGRNMFSCLCIPGWEGIHCEKDIDECLARPCQNGASCINGQNMFSCLCVPGWEGINCEKDIDECLTRPCQNGASCINGQNMYSCLCIPGWEGINCETDTDECLSSPCQNGATCNDLLNRYTCTCPEDFTGTNCEIDMCVPHHPAGADVVFVLDSSHSQGTDMFEKQKEYIKSFITNFPIGDNDFRFSVVTFSYEAKVVAYLNSYDTQVNLLDAVDNVTFIDGPSYTGKALEKVRLDVLQPGKGARSVYHYVIVLTNGISSNRKDTAYQAVKLKNSGVHVIAIGIGKQVLHEELMAIASDPGKVFPATNKDALNSILKSHVMATCPDCFRNTTDIAILMDASKYSDKQPNLFYKRLNALRVLVKASPINKDGVHVSYIRFAEDVLKEIDFDDYTTRDSFNQQIVSSPRLGRMDGSPNVSKALEYLYFHGFSTSTGRRQNARKMAVLFSNGNFDDVNSVQQEANRLKDSGVTIVTVASGSDVNMTSLLSVASDPAFVYVVGDDVYTKLDVLYSLTGTLEYDVCEFD